MKLAGMECEVRALVLVATNLTQFCVFRAEQILRLGAVSTLMYKVRVVSVIKDTNKSEVKIPSPLFAKNLFNSLCRN